MLTSEPLRHTVEM